VDVLCSYMLRAGTGQRCISWADGKGREGAAMDEG
jgi:hypothetical protein